MNHKNITSLCTLLFLISCGQAQKPKKNLVVQGSGEASMLVSGISDSQSIHDQARALNLKVVGDAVLKISGDVENMNALQIDESDKVQMIQDAPLTVSAPAEFEPDHQSFYQAKKDFGFVEFWKKRPEADGRGVVVGVMDDGISPHQAGFKLTTDGKRKFLKKGSHSTFSTFPLIVSESGDFTTTVDEVTKTFNGAIDFNSDGKSESWGATVSADGKKICLDLNTDKVFSADECKGSFSQTGDYFVLPAAKKLVLMTEVDLAAKTLQILPSERGGDAHGEGVASVLAGHLIGNIPGFDGVAPGAQIVDYDLSEYTNKVVEQEYTIGTFINGLDWLGKNGAEVTNVSYSFYFTNAKAQAFMAQAFDAIVKKHNMVISFSAGNNGPGLGSLNRRAMYPSSVLVAGAYVSPELDEHVHGVTGLPEEGRVVFYSSRGPGPMGVGPTLIAPLSSLTHSSPEVGFTAFNGTSSASPALAGAAAVFVSALKQEGLKIDAPTVVHALRLSGRQLKNEPFIAQGYGLPQIETAISFYKKLIRGEQYLFVDSIVNKGSIDGVEARGVVIKTSVARDIETRKIQLGGVLSALAPADTVTNLVIPVNIEYSAGITGPSELWVASSSKMFVDIDVAAILKNNPIEAFGEIRIKSKTDGTLMSIIPVTIINDLDVRKTTRINLKVSSQEGKRIHFNAAPGVKGFRLRITQVSGEDKFLELSVFDPSWSRAKYTSVKRELWVHTPTPGHYQVGLDMNGGSSESAELQFEIETIDLKVTTTFASAEAPKIKIANYGMTPVYGVVILQSEPKTLGSSFFNYKKDSKLGEVTLSLKKGSYKADLSATTESDISYMSGNCSTRKLNADGTEDVALGSTFKNTKDEEVKVTFKCTPFDWGAEGDETVAWVLRVLDASKSVEVRADLAGRKFSEITLPKTEPGTYTVWVRDSISQDAINLGSVEVN
jgi:subtilisin family serine protease